MRNFASELISWSPISFPNLSVLLRTVLAVAGKDFCVVASDTRLGLGYSIPSRKVSRILKMYVACAVLSQSLLPA